MKSDVISDTIDHISEAAVTASSTRIVPAGSVLIVTRSGILRHSLPVAVTRTPVAINQDLKALIPDHGVLPDYVAWAIRHYADDILHACSKTGTTVQNIEFPRLLRFSVPLAPEPQQQHIVQEIEKQWTRLDAAVAALKRVQANLKRYRAAVLQAGCDGAFTPDVNPRAWSPVSYGEITTSITSGSRAWRRFLNAGNGRFIRIQEVADGFVDLANAPRVDAPRDKEADRARIRKNDILITIVGDVGRVSLVREEPSEAYVSQSVALTRPSQDVDPRFLELYLRSPGHGQAHFRRLAYGVGRGHLLLSHLRDVPILLPPTEVQGRIVDEAERRLSLVDELEREVVSSLFRSDSTRQAILASAFSGNLSRNGTPLADS